MSNLCPNIESCKISRKITHNRELEILYGSPRIVVTSYGCDLEENYSENSLNQI